MTLVLLLLAVLLVGVVAAVATGRVGGGLPPAAGTGPRPLLPPDAVGPGDLEDLRFSVVLRGYRMDEVDAVLDRLRDELAERDARLAALAPAAAATRPARDEA